MKNNDTEKRVEETLALFDSIPKVKANPFFYTRLKTRMSSQRKTSKSLVELIHVRLVIAVVGLLLLIIANTYSVLDLSSKSEEVTKKQALESFAESFNFTYNEF